MTLAELYERKKKNRRPSPALVFVKELAEVTKKSMPTVRSWLLTTNPQTPDALTRSVIAKHLKMDETELFPIKK